MGRSGVSDVEAPAPCLEAIDRQRVTVHVRAEHLERRPRRRRRRPGWRSRGLSRVRGARVGGTRPSVPSGPGRPRRGRGRRAGGIRDRVPLPCDLAGRRAARRVAHADRRADRPSAGRPAPYGDLARSHISRLRPTRRRAPPIVLPSVTRWPQHRSRTRRSCRSAPSGRPRSGPPSRRSPNRTERSWRCGSSARRRSRRSPEETGRPLGTVKTHLHRGLARLRGDLEGSDR